MKIDEAIQQFTEANKAITDYFGVCLESPTLNLDDPWFLIGDNEEIRFANPADFNPDDSDCFQYSFEIIHAALWIKDEFTAARVNDGCGHSFCVIFANKNRHKEFEA